LWKTTLGEFLCFYLLFIPSLVKWPLSFPHYLIGVLVILLWGDEGASFTLDTGPLCDMWLVVICSQYVACRFLWVESLAKLRLLTLMTSMHQFFLFINCIFLVSCIKLFTKPSSLKIFSYFLS
jgi:hypothetical protein